jgi:hypothetical protein
MHVGIFNVVFFPFNGGIVNAQGDASVVSDTFILLIDVMLQWSSSSFDVR